MPSALAEPQGNVGIDDLFMQAAQAVVSRRREEREERKETARNGLIDFCGYVDPNAADAYQAKHLRHIAERLEAVERGECKRLMIFMPPRHWKSSLCSDKFPAWFLGRNPHKTVIATSYSGDLANSFSVNVRDMIGENEAFGELFPKCKLKPKQRAADKWALDGAYRATYRAAGVFGGITGRGGHLILIDDPVADQFAVATRNLRDKMYSWYTTKLRNRLEPGGAIVLIMTRWHPDDLAGRLLKAAKEGGEQWEVIALPAIAEPNRHYPWEPSFDEIAERNAEKSATGESDPITVSPAILYAIDAIGRASGEALWPERWSLAELAAIKSATPPRDWSALYQQRPRAAEGNILDSRKLIRIFAKDLPPMVRQVRFWDLAFSEAQGADRLCGCKVGEDKDGNRYILHMEFLRGRWPENKPKIIDLALEDGIQTHVVIEANGTQLGYAQDVQADKRLGFRKVAGQKPEGNKEMRAETWGSRLVLNEWYIVVGYWNQDIYDEMDDFPNGEHDDGVDGVSGCNQYLNTPPETPGIDPLQRIVGIARQRG